MSAPQGPAAPNRQQQAVSLLSQVPFGSIIGGPLKAAVDAQATAASACYDFINKVGMVDVMGKDNAGKDVVVGRRVADVSFTFQRTNKDNPDKKDELSITVPVLTILPLPFIRIESLTLNFKAAISAVDTSEQKTDTSLAGEGKLDLGGGFGPFKASITGSISSKKDSTATSSSKYSVEQTIDISVHAVQDDMPGGMALLLKFLTDHIETNNTPAKM